MSAYIVDPRTIDYLVQYAGKHDGGHMSVSTPAFWETAAEIPEDLAPATSGDNVRGFRLHLDRADRTALGRVLMRANVRSVAHRYGDKGHCQYWGEDHGMDPVAPDDLPGPNDQKRVWGYEFRRINAELRPEWVLSLIRCLDYQSCETGQEWRESLARTILDALEEKAISEIIDREDAPWGIDAGTLVPVG